MPTNYYLFFIVAIIPLAIGAVYYHPKAFGTAWMKANGFTEENMKGGNMAVIFGLTYLLSLFLAVTVAGLVIHQAGIIQALMSGSGEWTPEAKETVNMILAEYGHQHRSFQHGALHGFIAAVMFALPIIGINALFERRGGKYIAIHFGYWAISLILMGGVLCANLIYSPIA